jgi:hypothetical protein
MAHRRKPGRPTNRQRKASPVDITAPAASMISGLSTAARPQRRPTNSVKPKLAFSTQRMTAATSSRQTSKPWVASCEYGVQ